MQAYAYAVSDSGRIAGKAMFGSGTFHAFRTIPSYGPVDANSDLGTLGGLASLSSETSALHDSSWIVGRSQNVNGYWRGFFSPVNCTGIVSGDELVRLNGVTVANYTSAAYGVNRYGHVVGYQTIDSGASRAFRFRSGLDGMIDLNTLLPPGNLWVLTKAVAINDGGVIVGYGTYNGQSTCWIMYPQCQE
jgi:probable HAF family extracellular repeat protein